MLDIMRQPPHPWTAGKREPDAGDLDRLRRRIVDLAALISETCPQSPERAEALVHLDAVAFHTVGAFLGR